MKRLFDGAIYLRLLNCSGFMLRPGRSPSTIKYLKYLVYESMHVRRSLFGIAGSK